MRGILIGVALVFASKVFINQTPVADWVVAPLMIPDAADDSQAIVVLGAGVIGACVPNVNAVRRVVLAVREWRSRRVPFVLFAGGSGFAGCRVADSMARLAEVMGMPSTHVRVEPASRSTHENAAFVAPLLRAWGVTRVLLVTDRLHMRRSVQAFAAEGYPIVARASVPIYEGHEDNVSMLAAGLREYMALAYYRLRGWAVPSPVAAPATLAPGAGGSAAAMKAVGPLAVIGASYAAAWPLTDVGGVPVVNRGVDGQRSFELLERFEQELVMAEPRAVLIWGFVNDVSRSTPDAVDDALGRVRQSYAEMVRVARRRGVVPIVATELTLRAPAGAINTLVEWRNRLTGRQTFQDYVNRHVRALNHWLVDFATSEGVSVLDFAGVLSDADGRRRAAFAQADGSHVSQAGYDMLTSYAVPIIEDCLGQR